MQLSSFPAGSGFPIPGESANNLSNVPLEQHSASAHNRVREDDPAAVDDDYEAASKAIPEQDVPKHFHAKVIDARHMDHSAYLKGYESPTAVKLPGYSATMSHVALMRLALDKHLGPQQLGALWRLSEQRSAFPYQAAVLQFTELMTGEKVKVTPMAQGYYLSFTNQASGGECAAISHLLAFAVAEGKQHVLLGNFYQALANPGAPESKAFFQVVKEIQARVGIVSVGHDPATLKVAPYTTIAPQLIGSATTKTLLIGAEAHRVTAGVIVTPQGQRSYYYDDPNLGFVEFFSAKAFEQGLKKIFTSDALKSAVPPIRQSAPNDPKYRISVFNPNRIPEYSSANNSVRFTYDLPLSGLDSVEIINASRLPTADDFRSYGPAPAASHRRAYSQVSEGLDKLHQLKGMSQYEQALKVLRRVKKFIADHPDSLLKSVMGMLKQKLTNTINEASAPADYPYAFELIEQQRARLAAQNLGEPREARNKVLQGVNVRIENHGHLNLNKLRLVFTAVDAALLKLQQRDPATANSLGTKMNVVVANPGDQPETRLCLGEPPTLIIGDDFFAPPSLGDNSVADRIANQAPGSAGDPIVQKQAALIAGKLGMVGYYKAQPKVFLAMAENRDPYTGGGHQLSKRAHRSAGDFLSEAFTARLYDGQLDNRAEAGLKTLLSPPPPPAQAPNVRPVATPLASASRSTDEADIARLQKLDKTRPPIRIGEAQVSRVDLYKMGARLDGQPIEEALTADPQGRKLSSSVQIDYSRFAANLKAASSDVTDRVANILGEIATNRDPANPPLISRADGGHVPESLQTPLREMAQHAADMQGLQSNNKPLAADFFSSGSTDTAGANKAAGLGFRAFSTFQALRSAVDNLQQGNTTAGAIGLGALAADYVGLGAEIGLNKVAQKAIADQAPSIMRFKAGSLGKMIGKAAGGVGLVFSVPFDTYNAVDSFKKAARSSGKEAQDHYVNGAFAVTNAVTSITLGAAFMAGAGVAGPVGLIVAGTLMVAQSIYSAVRTVEDIDKHTSLSGVQKFTLGMQSFLGFEPGFAVMKPYLEAKYTKEYAAQNQVRYEAFLKGEGKEYFERVVFGSTDVEAKQTPGKVRLTPALWYSPVTWLLHQIKVPGQVPTVSAKGGGDSFLGPFKSLNGKPVHAVEGEQGEHKATLWDMGDGDDWVVGMETKPNYFLLGGGKKAIKGGSADDTVVINADARQTLERARQVAETEKDGFSPRQISIDGGGGRNTLTFSGALSSTYREGGEDKTAQYVGHVINLKTHTVAIKTEQSNTDGVKKIAHAQSFSNVTTVENGESLVQGNDENNLITLNGDNDVAYTGKGANVIVVNGGADIFAEGGFNTYVINKHHLGVTIVDPADSVIRLDYSAAQVADWSVSPKGDLVVILYGQTDRQTQKLVIRQAFAKDSTDDRARPTFITNDGLLMTITAPRKAGSSLRVPQVNGVKIEASHF